MKLFKLSNKRLILIVFSCCLLNFWGLAQKAPMKYGKINKADLELKVYPTDTSAAAAILCNYGYFNSNQIQFTWNIRIKIFKKEGTQWGDQVFPVPSRSDVRGITFNLENGQVVESKLKSESIFKERISKSNTRIRVAMPNVKEGSIIDLEFTFQGLPSEWRFQDQIPVRWSELVIESSPYLDFNTNFSGFETLAVSTDGRWVGKDMPAFKKEPFMNDISNYINKTDIELRSLVVPNVINYYGTTSWNAVYKNLYDDENFGGIIASPALFLNSVAKEIESTYTDPFEKIKAAIAAAKKMKWNEYYSLFSSSTSLSSTYNKKIGNSADINLLLIRLLKKLDFETYPLAISTRNNGFLPLYTPTIDKFNYVLAYVIVKDKTYILDATEENMPAGLLPKRCFNLRGRIIDDKKQVWVDLIPEKKTKKVIMYDLKLETDNQLTGKLSYNRIDYAAFDFRKSYEKFNSKGEYIKDFENDHKGLTVIDFKADNLDSIYKPITDDYQVKIKNVVNTAGNLLYINPMLYQRMEENPFKVTERKYPVDFIYPVETVYLFKLTLPDGVKVSQLPRPLIIKLPDNSASCIYQMAANGNTIQLSYKYLINKPIFSESQYADLREFFTEVVKKQSEPIVLSSN